MAIRKLTLGTQERAWIAKAFAFYPYPSASFYHFKNKEKIERYILLNISVMLEYCAIYSLDDQAVMLISDEKSVTPIFAYFRLLIGMIKILGWKDLYKNMEFGSRGGSSQEIQLRKEGKSFIHIELLAVKQEAWNHGYMSRLLKDAKEMAKERGCLCIIETDEEHRKQKYLHNGFLLYKTRILNEEASIFDLRYDPSKDHTD